MLYLNTCGFCFFKQLLTQKCIHQASLVIKKIHSNKFYFSLQAKNQGTLQIIQTKTLQTSANPSVKGNPVICPVCQCKFSNRSQIQIFKFLFLRVLKSNLSWNILKNYEATRSALGPATRCLYAKILIAVAPSHLKNTRQNTGETQQVTFFNIFRLLSCFIIKCEVWSSFLIHDNHIWIYFRYQGNNILVDGTTYRQSSWNSSVHRLACHKKRTWLKLSDAFSLSKICGVHLPSNGFKLLRAACKTQHNYTITKRAWGEVGHTCLKPSDGLGCFPPSPEKLLSACFHTPSQPTQLSSCADAFYTLGNSRHYVFFCFLRWRDWKSSGKGVVRPFNLSSLHKNWVCKTCCCWAR